MTKPIPSRPIVCKRILLVIACIFFTANIFAQVGISSTSITPDATSILELRSTTLGFLAPRMTTTQRDAITSPATGLLIYNTTTNQLNYYSGSSWQVVTGGSQSQLNGIGFVKASGTTISYDNSTYLTSALTSFSKTDNYGITSSVTNPTTTPNHTIGVDTTLISSRLWRQKGIDSLSAIIATKGIGTVTSVTSATGDATIATTTSTPVITIVSAPKLQTARTINGVLFDGSANITIPNANLTGDVTSVGNATTLATVNANVGTFNSVTVNAKGLVTAASNTTTELTGKTNTDVNSTYPDNATYWSNVTIINGFPADGFLSGIRKGTFNSQRLQDQTNGATYARAWIEGTSSWTIWAVYLDGNDFVAKGDMIIASGNNSVGVLSVGTDGQVLTADAASLNGVKWSTGGGGSGTITSMTVATANGFSGTVTNPTTTPDITISTNVTGIVKGNGTSLSAAIPADFPTLNQNTTGNAATVTTNANLTGPITSVGNATTVTANVITNAMLVQVPTQTFKGRTTAATGNVEDMTVAQAKTLLGLTGSNTGDQTISLTGEVTGSGTGSFATTIATNAVTNSKLAQIATQTFKGRITAGTGNVEDLTIAQTKTLLNLTGTNSGDQTITLTGDVTGSGTGSFASTIGNSAVTYSKIQNVSATNKVLGRTTAGAGIVEEISTTGSGNVVRANSPALVTPTGIVKSDVGLNNVDNTSDVNKPVSTATQTALDLKINLTDKGANNGVATLDAGGKVPTTQLPVGAQVYKGTWSASTNTPTLVNGTGTSGWTYRVTVAGTVNFGAGAITFTVGDDVIYNGTIWQRNPSSSSVSSVNTQTGTVVLTTDNINEGTTNKYYTDTRARTSLSVTAPLAYNSGTGAFSIPLATTLVSGYLSTTDWNTFNGKQATGNYITALTGDVTATGPGSVGTTIANNAVTYGKMQAMTANKLLGSGASGTAVSEITLGTGLSFTGSTLNASTTGGTVTNASVVSANGFAGTVSNATTTPAITLSTSVTGILKGDGTSMSAAVAGDFPTLNQNTTGNAATVTTNANLTGPVTSVGNATTISANAITNAMLAQIPTQTFKGRTSAATGNVEDLTATQATAMLNTFTASAQGVVPASGGGTATFLRADGTFASANYRNLVTLGSDVINSNATANTLADVTGLSFTVVAGTTYHFYALIPYTSAASSTGSRWTINAPATTLLSYTSRYTLTATTQTINYASAVGIPAASNASSLTNNIAIIEGVIKPSASGTFIIRFASKTANSAITAKAGATLEWW